MQDIDDVLLRKHCKEGASVVTYFWVPHKKYKKIHIKKYIRKEKNRSEKRMLELP
jgi:hypothetical protein